VSRGDQVGGHGRAHVAKSDESDVHVLHYHRGVGERPVEAASGWDSPAGSNPARRGCRTC
jgi:hypothetical protein